MMERVATSNNRQVHGIHKVKETVKASSDGEEMSVTVTKLAY